MLAFYVMNYTWITSHVDQKNGNALRFNTDHWRHEQFCNESQNAAVLNCTEGCNTLGI
jgi:hypothetical protein